MPMTEGRARHISKIYQVGAGEGNRTLVVSLGSFCSTIELHPRSGVLPPSTGRPMIGDPGDDASDPVGVVVRLLCRRYLNGSGAKNQ